MPIPITQFLGIGQELLRGHSKQRMRGRSHHGVTVDFRIKLEQLTAVAQGTSTNGMIKYISKYTVDKYINKYAVLKICVCC